MDLYLAELIDVRRQIGRRPLHHRLSTFNIAG